MTVRPPGRQRSIDRWLDEHGDDVIAVRRSLHANPELSNREHATTELVGERLRLAGLEPRLLTTGTGLWCDIEPDATIVARGRLAFRADLDALAMDDEKDVDYRSKVPGVAHACGHDVHTSIMLGTALYFARHRDQMPGPLRFIFQPAEEIVPGGAFAAIADGALGDVDAILGVHCDPKLETGLIAVKDGAISSAADMATISLRGPGGHTARPERTVDIIALAAHVVSELPGRVTTQVGDDSVRVVFGMLRAGDAANVIPTQCTMRASVRTPSTHVWEQLQEVVEHALHALVDGTGASHTLDYVRGVPPVVNHPGITDVVRAAATDELGPDAVVAAEQSWGGDDFAWYVRVVPGTFVRLGVHDPTRGGPALDLHSGAFDADEAAIPVGIRLLVASTARYFRATALR